MLKVLLLAGVLALIAVMVPIGTMSRGLWERVRARPIDVSEVREHLGIQVPMRLVALVKTDQIAFRVHATMAGLIERNYGDPAAYGVQWFKASAHARSSSEVEQAAAGLLRSKQQSRDVASFQSTICHYVENGYYTGYQRQALSSAGLICRSGA